MNYHLFHDTETGERFFIRAMTPEEAFYAAAEYVEPACLEYVDLYTEAEALELGCRIYE